MQGHLTYIYWISRFKDVKLKYLYSGGGGGGGCHRCGEMGHFARECPNMIGNYYNFLWLNDINLGSM